MAHSYTRAQASRLGHDVSFGRRRLSHRTVGSLGISRGGLGRLGHGKYLVVYCTVQRDYYYVLAYASLAILMLAHPINGQCEPKCPVASDSFHNFRPPPAYDLANSNGRYLMHVLQGNQMQETKCNPIQRTEKGN